ncbi:hypothetical protein DR62_05925 [Burkholderia thailandensis]|nr:hypothetical protein DR62_05925 [Burkholderia thailandensis]AOI53426.1 hypothetical protein WI24_02710 [Burkholderia thailandensis]AOJ52431.1 hypothetical protein AQ475_02740 [Burkholderia thailandensis]AOJ57923.1 hypothetical protein AQ477_16385 [Burkholderia thailandensis]AVR26998.1 hypothetical protein A8H32_09105 [Burkholderia thailandensis]
MSLAIGVSRWAALREGEAVDDMIMEMGSAADYKANRRRAGPSCDVIARFSAVRPMSAPRSGAADAGAL